MLRRCVARAGCRRFSQREAPSKQAAEPAAEGPVAGPPAPEPPEHKKGSPEAGAVLKHEDDIRNLMG